MMMWNAGGIRPGDGVAQLPSPQMMRTTRINKITTRSCTGCTEQGIERELRVKRVSGVARILPDST
jgi:hypothetical protein